MKKHIFLLAVFLFFASPNALAESKGYDLVAELKEENIKLYAKEKNGLYYDFKIDYKGSVYSRPFWLSVAHAPAYAPNIIYEDLNNDEKKELIIILNKGYGTGVLLEEAYVFHVVNNRILEILVDNPIAIINKNVKTVLSTEKAEIIVGDKKYLVDITPLKVKPTNLFSDIGFGSMINYEVKDQQLTATVPAQISPAGFIGQLVIEYEFRDKMYQEKSIEFQASPDIKTTKGR